MLPVCVVKLLLLGFEGAQHCSAELLLTTYSHFHVGDLLSGEGT